MTVGRHDRIPVPWRHRWREIRIRGVPVFVFLVTGAIAFQLWSGRVASANLQGVAVGATAEVRSPQGGILFELDVDPFQPVSAGTVVGRVMTTDPQVLAARLAVVLAEVEMMRHGLGPMDNLRRNELNRSTLDMDLMRDRITLASARIEQDRVNREYDRIARLREADLVTEDEYDRIRTERDRLALEIAEQDILISSMSQGLAQADNRDGASVGDAPLSAAIRMQEERLRLIEAELMPVEIVSPIDGLVSGVVRRTGETVTAGEPIVVVHSPRLEYVVGYLPHPLRIDPEPGMRVVVRSRSTNRAQYEGEVVAVGAQVGAMEGLQPHPTQLLPTGLPIKVTLDRGAAIRPGEVVDMTLFDRPRDPE
jgi:multidrug resistance efflux pump